MQGVARNFFTLAIIYALAGMALGLHMSITRIIRRCRSMPTRWWRAG